MVLRCSGGYNQAVFKTWFHEPHAWMEQCIADHCEIRDSIMEVIRDVPGVSARATDSGSYLFVIIPELEVSMHQFVRIAREMAGVTVMPGTEFVPQFIHEFRINFSQDKGHAILAMKRLFELMYRYRKH